jgi:O-antigen ligase
MATVVHPHRWAILGSAVRDRGLEGLAVRAVAVTVWLFPLLVPKGPGNSGPVDVVMAAALVATLLWAGSTRNRLHLPYAIPFGILAGAGALSALLGDFPSDGLLALVQECSLLALCAAIANLARSPRALESVLRAWSWSAIAWATLLVVAIAAQWETLAGTDFTGGSRAALTFENSNLAASYFVLSLMVVLASGQPRNRLVRTVGSGIIIAALALTGSLAGLLGLVVALAVAAVVTTAQRGGPMPATALLVGLLLAGGIAFTAATRYQIVQAARGSQIRLLQDSIGRGTESASERGLLFGEQLDLYSTGGLLGHGPASTKPTLERIQAPYPREAHNDYIAALIERGLVGALGIVVLIGAVAVRAAGIVGPLAPPFARVVPATAPLVGGLAAAGFMGLTHEGLHQRHLWALLGVVAAIYLWGRRPRVRELDR